MPRSKLSIVARWRAYQRIPIEYRDVLDLWWLFTGY